MPGIFMLTGSTGHIGGAVLDLITQQHPEVPVKLLVRTQEQADRLVSKYPDTEIEFVLGDLKSLDLITAASREVDIVIHAGPDITHDAAIEAMTSGLKKREGSNGYYIHTSGGYIVIDTSESGGLAEARTWDDIDDVEEIISMPDEAVHSVTDQLTRSAWPDVNVAIIAPGLVLGTSPSTGHPLPITLPFTVQAARAFNSGFQISSGQNQLGFIDVLDIARMYLILVNDALAALSGAKKDTPFPLWGPQAYYFGVSENVSINDYMKGIMIPLQKCGIITGSEVVSSTVTDVARRCLAGNDYDADSTPPPPDSWATHIAAGFSFNMRMKSSRMRHLGWKPEQGPVVRGMDKAIPEYVRYEKQQTT